MVRERGSQGRKLRFGRSLLLLDLAFCLAAVQGGLVGSSFVGYANVRYGCQVLARRSLMLGAGYAGLWGVFWLSGCTG